MNRKMTYVINYTQGSGQCSQTIRGCSSQAEAEAKFWSHPSVKQNPKTVIIEIVSYPSWLIFLNSQKNIMYKANEKNEKKEIGYFFSYFDALNALKHLPRYHQIFYLALMLS